MAMIHLEPQTAQMFSRALGALKPPPNLTLSQWADNYRRLSAEASAAQGRWNTDNAPFQREIMDAIGDVHIRKVVAMMCAQSGGKVREQLRQTTECGKLKQNNEIERRFSSGVFAGSAP